MARFSLLVCSEYPVALGLADRFLVSQQVGDYRPATLSIGAVSTRGACRSAIRYRSYWVRVPQMHACFYFLINSGRAVR